MEIKNKKIESDISFEDYRKKVLKDYELIVLSRQTSLLGRREVLTGKGKFGIFGDGKELPQIAMNHFFKDGDYRSGYYRDQTLLMAHGHLTPKNHFAGLYAHVDINHEPMSAGRQMVGHFSSQLIDDTGEWLDQTKMKNHISDVSSTGTQMSRLVGLAQASKIYRKLDIKTFKKFSKNGNEIAWGSIGNASTSEGLFFEAINAIGVLQIPVVISVYDDGYGISVENKQQTVKKSISKALEGFKLNSLENGLEILSVKGWDYPELIKTYSYASKIAREKHIPVLIHVTELTQPLGHSTSGSHERYKSKKRLEWEIEFDCNKKMREWILANGFCDEQKLMDIEKTAKKTVSQAKIEAWKDYQEPINNIKEELNKFFVKLISENNNDVSIKLIEKKLNEKSEIFYHDVISSARRIRKIINKNGSNQNISFEKWFQKTKSIIQKKFSSNLYSIRENVFSEEREIKPEYNINSPMVDGRIILRDNFDKLFMKDDRLIIFGEDCGKIGGVNQGLEGLQKKYGKIRVADTGIREATIVGQGIGMALRGLRPIAEVQYLDYILFCIQILSDDLASLSYRTKGRQIAPIIIRTRGHRLEGIWHSGSPMAGMINLLRGILILVPRNMTQAAGFYNRLIKLNQPAIVIEPLNGYRIKEKLPENMTDFVTPIGKIEILKNGSDITLVSYGSTLRIVCDVAIELEHFNIHAEVIDVQSLLPFDVKGEIKTSVMKTNRLIIIDEDMPGGATAYILQQLLDHQNIFSYLDSEPKLISAKPHRPPYGEDGDYFSKPSADDIFEEIYEMMHEYDPKKFPRSSN